MSSTIPHGVVNYVYYVYYACILCILCILYLQCVVNVTRCSTKLYHAALQEVLLLDYYFTSSHHSIYTLSTTLLRGDRIYIDTFLL